MQYACNFHDAFVGDIEQVPPMVSALKVGGRRLYEMAHTRKLIQTMPPVDPI